MPENEDARLFLPPSVRDLAVAELLRGGNKDWPARVFIDLSPAPLGLVCMRFDPSVVGRDELYFLLGPGRTARRAAAQACSAAWSSIARRSVGRPSALAALAPFVLLAPLHLPLFLAGGAVFSRLKPLGHDSNQEWHGLLRFLLLVVLSIVLILPGFLLSLPAVATHDLHGGFRNELGGGHFMFDEPSFHEALEASLREEGADVRAKEPLRALLDRFLPRSRTDRSKNPRDIRT